MKSLEDMTVQELHAEAKASREKATLFDSLLTDPTTRTEALKLIKRNKPNMPIPEIDAEASAEAKIAEERKERLALEARVRDSEMRERIGAERKRVMTQHNLSDADMIEVEKLMTDEAAPIAHYDAAVKVFKASKILAEPTPAAIQPPTFDMPDRDIWQPGIGNKAKLDKIAMTEAYKAYDEVTRTRPH